MPYPHNRHRVTYKEHTADNCLHSFSLGRCQCFIITGLLLGFFLVLFHGFRPPSTATLSFVRVVGSRLEADCRPFRVIGFNTHDLIQAATMTMYDFDMKNGKSGRARVRQMLHEASHNGLNVIRTWAHTNDPSLPFQTSPGDYHHLSFTSLDYILDEARRYGIRVILSFVDNWKYYNGVDQYVDWSGSVPRRTQSRAKERSGDPTPEDYSNEEVKRYEAERHSLFFRDEGCKEIYKNHVKAIVHRRNGANGMIYKDDPTILGWDLINEPRCETWAFDECAEVLQRWINEMAEFVKKEDPNHLVTVGSEGFFPQGSTYEEVNPQDWGFMLGQDWIRNHQSKHIDFMSVHIWPDNWNRTDFKFQERWIRSHLEAAKQLQKPVLIEEFGKKLESSTEEEIQRVRDPVYEQVYNLVEESMKEGEDVYGTLFWRWNLPLLDHKEHGVYGVSPSDSTFDLVKRHASFIHSLTNALPSRGDCMRHCWVPHDSARRCVQRPEVCQAVWSLDCERITRNLTQTTVLINGQQTKLTEIKIFPSRLACCLPGLGAFEQGCAWTIM